MKRWFWRLVLSGLAFFMTYLIVNEIGQVMAGPTGTALAHIQRGPHILETAIAIFCLSLVNSLVRPLIRLLSMPITMMTFGAWMLVVNAVLFWAVGHFTGGYEVSGIVGYLISPIVMGFLTWALCLAVRD